MELLTESPSLVLGLIGWAATAKLFYDSDLAAWQRRVMIVFTWLLWMIPAFDVTVYLGLMPSHTAVTLCAGMTMVLAMLVSLGSVRWHYRQ